MDFRQTLLLYLLIGAGVAIGFAARTPDKGRAWATILAAYVFWPLFVPLLLSAEEDIPTTPTTPAQKSIESRIARSAELLDRLAATGSSLGIPELPKQVDQIKAQWVERSAWLTETGLLIQALQASHPPTNSSTMASPPPQIEELQRLQHTTTESLERSLNGIDELAVHLQLLKAPGIDRTVEMARIERVLRAILELEDNTA